MLHSQLELTNTSIPIITGGSDEDDKQFSLRLFIDGAAYQQCVFSGNASTATVFVTPGINYFIACIVWLVVVQLIPNCRFNRGIAIFSNH